MLAEELKAIKELVKILGIPEYFDGLNDEEILVLGLHYYSKHIESTIDDIKEDMKDE